MFVQKRGVEACSVFQEKAIEESAYDAKRRKRLGEPTPDFKQSENMDEVNKHLPGVPVQSGIPCTRA